MGNPTRGLFAGVLVTAALAGCDPRALPRQPTPSDDRVGRDASAESRGDAPIASLRDGAGDLGGADPAGCAAGSDPCVCAAVHEAMLVNRSDPACADAADPFVAAIKVCPDCGETPVVPVIGNRG